MRKFQVLGVILIDCWTSANSLSSYKNEMFYSRIEQFLSDRIDYENIVSTVDDLDPRLQKLPGKHITVKSWDELNSRGLTVSNWLIAGHAWGICFHNCLLGIKEFISKDYPTMNLFTHADLIDFDHTCNRPFTNSDLENDSEIHWDYQRPVDLWAVNIPGRPGVQILV